VLLSGTREPRARDETSTGAPEGRDESDLRVRAMRSLFEFLAKLDDKGNITLWTHNSRSCARWLNKVWLNRRQRRWLSSFEVSNYEVVRPTGEQVPEPSTVVCGLEGSSFVMVWCLTTDFHSMQRGSHWYQWRGSRTGAEGL